MHPRCRRRIWRLKSSSFRLGTGPFSKRCGCWYRAALLEGLCGRGTAQVEGGERCRKETGALCDKELLGGSLRKGGCELQVALDGLVVGLPLQVLSQEGLEPGRWTQAAGRACGTFASRQNTHQQDRMQQIWEVALTPSMLCCSHCCCHDSTAACAARACTITGSAHELRSMQSLWCTDEWDGVSPAQDLSAHDTSEVCV